VEPQISLHALTGISSPQTLKLIGYIKHHKVIILIDNNNTHNFIHHRITQETHCYIHAVNKFQIMIANGGSMKCGGHCENVCLQIGDYSLKSHMFSIEMGGCDIVLGVEWLHTLGPITMDFQGVIHELPIGWALLHFPRNHCRFSRDCQLTSYGKTPQKRPFWHYHPVSCYSSL
jgi:hypothetical protein